MCLMLFAFKAHPVYDLILAGNRDEFYSRPTSPAKFWEDDPNLLAGKDIQAGGTWFGVNRTGQFAGITNYRDPKSIKKNSPSRGLLVSRFLHGNERPDSFLNNLKKEADSYNGFNILLGNKDVLFWYSNRGENIRKLNPGIYGLSNHLLDTPWPKVIKGKAEFSRLLSRNSIPEPDEFFNMLGDHSQAADDDLPSTGVSLERERMLSSIFISSPDYGTRSSTLLLIDKHDNVTFIERTFNGEPNHSSTIRYDFKI